MNNAQQYNSKIVQAATLAAAAYVRGGLAGMRAELTGIKDPVISSEFGRLYYLQWKRAEGLA